MTALFPSFLLAYSLQLATVVAALFVVMRALAPRSAGFRLRVWQAALALIILLPAISFSPMDALSPGAGATRVWTAPLSIEAASSAAPRATWPSWVVVALLMGAALRAGWIGTGLVALRRRFATARLEDDSRFADACAAVGVEARLLWRTDVSHPFTYGIAPPVVVAPADLAAASDATLRAIFVHELMHVKRRDWRWVIAEEAIRAALWF